MGLAATVQKTRSKLQMLHFSRLTVYIWEGCLYKLFTPKYSFNACEQPSENTCSTAAGHTVQSTAATVHFTCLIFTNGFTEKENNTCSSVTKKKDTRDLVVC